MDFRTSTAARRYVLRLVPAMISYAVAVVVLHAWLESAARPVGLWLYAAALIPALPILRVIWAMGRYLVEETDEYQKALLIRSMLWALALTLAVTTVWGFLENYAHVGHALAYYVFILFCAALGLVQGVSKLMERA